MGLAIDNPIPDHLISAPKATSRSHRIRFTSADGYEIGISLGIEAHGFIQVDAMVQFRPFHFEARIAAGFDVSAGGFSFASVTLEGSISGPGPIVIRGSLSIDVFLFSLSWSEQFTLGSGPSDTLPAAPLLLDVIFDELNKAENVHSGSIADPHVVLSPQLRSGGFAAVPPTGTLQVQQRRAPLGLLIERVDGRPLSSPQGVKITSGTTDVTDRFSPGSYITLTDSEALNRPPFDLLAAGRVISPADADPSEGKLHGPAQGRADRHPLRRDVDRGRGTTRGPRRGIGARHCRRPASGAEQYGAARDREAGRVDGDERDHALSPAPPRHISSSATTRGSRRPPLMRPRLSIWRGAGMRHFYSRYEKALRMSAKTEASGRLQGKTEVVIADFANPPATKKPEAKYELFGPGDVQRLAAGAITRRFPAPNSSDAEADEGRAHRVRGPGPALALHAEDRRRMNSVPGSCWSSASARPATSSCDPTGA